MAGVILVDGKQKVASLNDRAQELLALKTRGTKSPAWTALPAELRAMVREARVTGRSPADRQLELRAGRRGPVRLRVSAVPVRAGRKNSGVLLVLNDLTPVRQMKRHLQQLDRLASIGTLAAGMAHEIKNALVAGKTFVDLLLEKHQDAELVEVVRREMARIDALVSQMRKFAGPAPPSFSRVRLHEVVEHSLRLLWPQLEGKKVSVNRSLLAAPDTLHGDESQLQQACVNLFLNALDALAPNGTLAIATENSPPGATVGGAQLRLTIKDDGVGIAPENLARLFEPFFTTKPSGTGLGLLITRQIIQEHRGAISVQSEPGKGTAFHILLPASA